MKKLVLLAIGCAYFGSMHGIFITTVEYVMARVINHSDLLQTDYNQIESALVAKSHSSGRGRLLLLTPEILGELKTAQGIYGTGLMKSFLPMAQQFGDEQIIQYLHAHGAGVPAIREENEGVHGERVVQDGEEKQD